MIHTQIVNDSSGLPISNYKLGATGSTTVVTTEGIKLEYSQGYQGILLVHDGTVDTITKEYSIDNINFYTAYDVTGANVSNIGAAPNSRFITLENIDTAGAIAPYIRFKMAGEGTVTTASMFYIHQE